MRLALTLLLALSAALAQGPPPGRGPGRKGMDSSQGPGARFLGAEPGMSGRTVKNAPYSADVVTESTQTLADGNRIRQTSNARVYRDSEGRTRREQALNLNGLSPHSAMPQLVFLNDPVAGVNFALNATDRTGAKSLRTPWNGGAGRGRMNDSRSPDSSRAQSRGNRPEQNQNLKSEALGRQTIEGLPVDGRRTTVIIPAGQLGNEQAIQIVTETWFSPDLQLALVTRRSDPRSGETVTKLINVTRAEPAHQLFEVPLDYKVTDAAAPRPASPAK